MSLLEHNINIISIYRMDGRVLQKTRMPQDPRDAWHADPWHADPWHSDPWHADPVLQGHLTPIQLCVIPHRVQRTGSEGSSSAGAAERLSYVPVDHIVLSTT